MKDPAEYSYRGLAFSEVSESDSGEESDHAQKCTVWDGEYSGRIDKGFYTERVASMGSQSPSKVRSAYMGFQTEDGRLFIRTKGSVA